jgi:hypothetical protein
MPLPTTIQQSGKAATGIQVPDHSAARLARPGTGPRGGPTT